MSMFGGLASGLFGGPNTNQPAAQVDTSGQNAWQGNPGDAAANQQAEQTAQGLALAQANGTGPSAATDLLKSQTAQAQANSNALAASGSGAGQGIARRNAMMIGANAAQQLGGQAAAARSAEQLGGISAYGGLAQGARAQDLQASGINANTAATNAQLQGQQNINNQQIAGQQQGANAATAGTILSAAGMFMSDAGLKTGLHAADADLKEPGGPAHITLREEPGFLLMHNHHTGQLGKVAVDPLSPSERREALDRPHGAGGLTSANRIRTEVGDADLVGKDYKSATLDKAYQPMSDDSFADMVQSQPISEQGSFQQAAHRPGLYAAEGYNNQPSGQGFPLSPEQTRSRESSFGSQSGNAYSDPRKGDNSSRDWGRADRLSYGEEPEENTQAPQGLTRSSDQSSIPSWERPSDFRSYDQGWDKPQSSTSSPEKEKSIIDRFGDMLSGAGNAMAGIGRAPTQRQQSDTNPRASDLDFHSNKDVSQGGAEDDVWSDYRKKTRIKEYAGKLDKTIRGADVDFVGPPQAEKPVEQGGHPDVVYGPDGKRWQYNNNGAYEPTGQPADLQEGGYPDVMYGPDGKRWQYNNNGAFEPTGPSPREPVGASRIRPLAGGGQTAERFDPNVGQAPVPRPPTTEQAAAAQAAQIAHQAKQQMNTGISQAAAQTAAQRAVVQSVQQAPNAAAATKLPPQTQQPMSMNSDERLKKNVNHVGNEHSLRDLEAGHGEPYNQAYGSGHQPDQNPSHADSPYGLISGADVDLKAGGRSTRAVGQMDQASTTNTRGLPRDQYDKLSADEFERYLDTPDAHIYQQKQNAGFAPEPGTPTVHGKMAGDWDNPPDNTGTVYDDTGGAPGKSLKHLHNKYVPPQPVQVPEQVIEASPGAHENVQEPAPKSMGNTVDKRPGTYADMDFKSNINGDAVNPENLPYRGTDPGVAAITSDKMKKDEIKKLGESTLRNGKRDVEANASRSTTDTGDRGGPQQAEAKRSDSTSGRRDGNTQHSPSRKDDSDSGAQPKKSVKHGDYYGAKNPSLANGAQNGSAWYEPLFKGDPPVTRGADPWGHPGATEDRIHAADLDMGSNGLGRYADMDIGPKGPGMFANGEAAHQTGGHGDYSYQYGSGASADDRGMTDRDMGRSKGLFTRHFADMDMGPRGRVLGADVDIAPDRSGMMRPIQPVGVSRPEGQPPQLMSQLAQMKSQAVHGMDTGKGLADAQRESPARPGMSFLEKKRMGR